MSTPHFYMGDESYRNGVDLFNRTGMNPIKEVHETHFDLEPVNSPFFFGFYTDKSDMNTFRKLQLCFETYSNKF